MDKAIKGVCK